MSLLEQEIAEQPVTLARFLSESPAIVQHAADRIRAFSPHFVVIAARGSSDNAARYAQYLFGAYNHLPVALATPSLFTFYHRPPALRQALVIGISQSGHSPDIVAVLVEGRQQGALTLAITNDPSSPLARAAELVLPLFAGEERAVAATKTYTAQLLALASLSAVLAGDRQRQLQLALVPTLVHETLERNRDLLSPLEPFLTTRHLVVLARGFNYATAFEIALKLKETCLIVAEPYSSADFRHGPIALIEPGFPIVAVAPTGEVFDDVARLILELRQRRATIAMISNDAFLLSHADLAMTLPTTIEEWLSPIIAVIPGQLLALTLARARGLDPDRPRGLQKVTQTL